MTTKKTRALAALLKARTRQEAAEIAGVDERTIRRYFDDEEFCAAYKRAMSDLLSDATRAAQSSIPPAVELLREIVEDAGRDDRLRIQAADRILTHATRLIEQFNIETRLSELERTMMEGEG